MGFNKMNFRIICCFIFIPGVFAGLPFSITDTNSNCLTGYMTDVQNWVDKYGDLTDNGNINSSSIVITPAESITPVIALEYKVLNFKCSEEWSIKYLSMAKCGLAVIPPGTLGNISVYYQDVRGLRTKTLSLFNNVICSSYDVIIMVETWLNDGVFDSEVFDDRYIVYRRDRESSGFHASKNGGGVLIAVSKQFQSTRHYNFESKCEDLWVSIELINGQSCSEKADYENIKIALNEINWKEILSSCPFVDEMVDKFYEQIRILIKKYVPGLDKNLNIKVVIVFQMSDSRGRSLADTVEYVTFYGNNFGFFDNDSDIYDVSLNATQITEVTKDLTELRKQLSLWSVGFQGRTFEKLRELDLRACSIQVIGDHTFRRMPQLRVLYLGENNIHYIESNAFSSLPHLNHLDLSRNSAVDENGKTIEMVFESLDLFKEISLDSLDLSYTKIGHRNIGLLDSLQKSLKKLSVCYSDLSNPKVESKVFTFTQLKYLDVSGNYEILCSPSMFQGLNNTLEVLYADNVAYTSMDDFKDYTKLQILKVSHNAISSVPHDVAKSLTSLQVLDLSNNKIVSWFENTFQLMKQLKLLNLKNNNINVITERMFEDIKNLTYIGLVGNLLVCNCYIRNIYEVGLRNEYFKSEVLFNDTNNDNKSDIVSFHTGFRDFNDLILYRNNITNFCAEYGNCNLYFDLELKGNFLLLDYSENSRSYDCVMMSKGETMALVKLNNCLQEARNIDIKQENSDNWQRFLLFILPGVILPLMFFVYIFRRNLRYFVITMRNSATLSMINNKDIGTEGAIFNYDVFVSYCNEDRAWVLDQLIPHVERDCNICVCLHERDFQVGLSILENIVSCMDRSRSIMLIISRSFLLSQWCQFEMHLAQHRLLETRREDLILILLEEVPRRLRPNTLHYLMLTKTYILWPTEESEQKLFWKRMKKSLVTQKLKQKENISLA